MYITRQLTIEDPLKFFRRLQRVIASICILIPLIFWLCDKDVFYPRDLKLITSDKIKQCGQVVLFNSANVSADKTAVAINAVYPHYSIVLDSLKVIPKDKWQFRNSVSDYANSTNSYLFGLLYCMAGLLFVFNGAVYINKPKSLSINSGSRWLNILTGLCLIGIVLVHNNTAHIILSVLFFVLNVYIMAFLSNANETITAKITRIVLAALVLISLGLWVCCFISLLWAEWLSLLFISLYLIMISFTTKTG